MAGKSTVRHAEEIERFKRECGRMNAYRQRLQEIRITRRTLLWKMSGCSVQSYSGVAHSRHEIEYGKIVEERERLLEEARKLQEKIRWVETCLAKVPSEKDRRGIGMIYGEGCSFRDTARLYGIAPQSLYRRYRRELDRVFDSGVSHVARGSMDRGL